jgi:hypothetical protein
MPNPDKSKTVFFYCFQVWLTSASIGPILWILSEGDSSSSLFSFVEFYGLALVFGLMLSVPSFLLLIAGVAFVRRRPWEVLTKKFAIAVWTIPLAIAPFLLIIDWRDPSLEKWKVIGIGAFLVPLIAAVFLFRWPRKDA